MRIEYIYSVVEYGSANIEVDGHLLKILSDEVFSNYNIVVVVTEEELENAYKMREIGFPPDYVPDTEICKTYSIEKYINRINSFDWQDIYDCILDKLQEYCADHSVGNGYDDYEYDFNLIER